jgi:hypothetical protein
MTPARRHGFPARAALTADGLHLALQPVGIEEFHDPFVADTLKRVGGEFSVQSIPLPQLGEATADTAPVGLIFHIARCGSTLVSQMLHASQRVAVYSEPIALNEILSAVARVDRPVAVAALRTLASRLAAHAGRPYVIKLSSWNALHADLVAEAFPGTPWAAVVRDPLEVCVSLQLSRPGWLRPQSGALFAAHVPMDTLPGGDEPRVARFIGAFCAALARLDAVRGVVLPYTSLPNAVAGRLAAHFGLTLDDAARQRMAEASRRDAKAPSDHARLFQRDTEAKRAAATPALVDAVRAFAQPAYERLLESMAARLA